MADPNDRPAGSPPGTVPSPADRSEGNAAAGRLAHRMNNAVSYVLTNLNLLAEELESSPPTDPIRRQLQLVVEATAGIERMSDRIRELKVLSWGTDASTSDSQDDTWDEERRPRRVL